MATLVAVLCGGAVADGPLGGLVFTIDYAQTKCLSEEFPERFAIRGRITVRDNAMGSVNFFIESPDRVRVFEQVNLALSHPFAYDVSAPVGGSYAFCAQHVPYAWSGKQALVELEVHSHSADIDRTQHLERLRPIEISLRLIEENARTLHRDYHYFRSREVQLSKISDSISSMVVWVLLTSVVFAAGVSFMQVVHLQRFFIANKFIS